MDKPSEREDNDHDDEWREKLDPNVVVHNASVESSLEHDFNEANGVVLEREIDGAVHHH